MAVWMALTTGVAHASEDAQWQSPFDGSTLDGWVKRGGKALYRAEDGAIVGTSVRGGPNTFLCTEKTYSDFVLELDFKVESGLNSGVQIRSQSYKAYSKGRVHGYQVEIDPSARAYSGGIYDEARRGWLYDLSGNEPARKAFKKGEWNHFRIEAVGPSIKTWINDVPAANLVDAMTPSGFIALQVHGTDKDKPMEVRWRNIRIKEVAGPADVPARPAAPPTISLNNLEAWREPTSAWMIVGDTFKDPDNERRLAWKAGTGVAVNGPRGASRHLFTKIEHADIEAHVEFMVPKGSNSGVYFQGRYEIQVFDSWGVEKPKHSDCGGIYQRWHDEKEWKQKERGYEGRPPRVNVSRKPGEWQSFDVIFRAPRFDDNGNKIANAMFVKVVHNGTVIHENEEVTGPTRAAAFNDEKPIGPLMFQGDHGPVSYRNIRVTALGDNPSTTAGNPASSDPYKNLVSYEFGRSREALMAIEADIRSAAPQRRKAIEGKLAAILKSAEATSDAKQFACRMLRWVGTADSVPALADLLAHEKLSHMARYALQSIPGPEVDQALLATLNRATGKTKAGIIDTLGERRNADAIGVLGELINNTDATVGMSAAAALGKIGGYDAIRTLARARSAQNRQVQEAVGHAILKCADQLAVQGETDLAATVFERAYGTTNIPTEMRVAAIVGLISATDGAAARTAAVEATRDQEEAVRLAALAALADVGDASTIPLLVDTATTKQGRERETACESLLRLDDPGVNAALLKAADDSAPAVRADLMLIWTLRQGTDPIRFLFEGTG
jgi:HEAT repeat protein